MGIATWGEMPWVERLAAVEEEVRRGGKGATSPGIRTTSPLRGMKADGQQAKKQLA